ncbi:hypothetical protein KY092_17400 [Natronomonas gomsonensis]|nr:hypothetical protein [Natronomonas gomsonensis]
MITFLVVGVVAAQPAAAQESANPVCQEDSGTLASMIEGFLQLTTALGLMGLLVVWQGESVAEMFTLSRDQLSRIKQHKITALKSAVILVLLGPLFALAGRTMDLPVAQCVDLTPF